PLRRSAPPSRAAVRLATALAGAAEAQPCGRLCLVRMRAATPAGADREAAAAADREALAAADREAPAAADPAKVVNAARYLAPVVLDLPADGSAAGFAAIADHVVVVASAADEPALLDAVASGCGGDPVKV